MASLFEEKLFDLKRKGDLQKAKWLESISRHITESQRKRIQANDKSVLQEIVLPKWVSWDLLFEWANSNKKEKGRRCALCNELDEVGLDYMEKFICQKCFLTIKNSKEL
jgi:hypothetical protein